MCNSKVGGASGRDRRVLAFTIAESPPKAPPTFRVLTLLLFCFLVPTGAQSTPPNVVLIISDDQGWGDYSFMGHPVIHTPHLDRLASESLLFPRGYVPSSVCRPSLATIITGLYPHQHLITGNDPAGLSLVSGEDPDYVRKNELLIQNIDRVATLPRLLAGQGYVSFQSGKWWEGHSGRGGFTAGMTHGKPPRFRRLGDDGLKIGREGLEPVPFFSGTLPLCPTIRIRHPTSTCNSIGGKGALRTSPSTMRCAAGLIRRWENFSSTWSGRVWPRTRWSSM